MQSRNPLSFCNIERRYLEAHNYSPLVQKKEAAERTEWEVELQRKISLTVSCIRNRFCVLYFFSMLQQGMVQGQPSRHIALCLIEKM